MVETITWINIDDRLPEEGQACLVWLPISKACADAFFERGQFFDVCCTNHQPFHHVNHWAEMPVGPLVSWENGQTAASSEPILDYAIAVFRDGIKNAKGFQPSFNDALMRAFHIYEPELFGTTADLAKNEHSQWAGSCKPVSYDDPAATLLSALECAAASANLLAVAVDPVSKARLQEIEQVIAELRLLAAMVMEGAANG